MESDGQRGGGGWGRKKIPLAVGRMVRVKDSVGEPVYGWGDVTRKSVGVLKEFDDEGDVVVCVCVCVCV